ncbi:MAG: hypothetical protein HDQ98_11720 [Lachnospiraceae bacterium]|nr:hypothetical protein [Lachnospiraceae bacterium]
MLRSKLYVTFEYGFVWQRVFTDKEHYAAIKEHYNIIYDDDPEEASQQFNVRMYYDEDFNPFYMPEDYIEEYGDYGTKWWEQEHGEL